MFFFINIFLPFTGIRTVAEEMKMTVQQKGEYVSIDLNHFSRIELVIYDEMKFNFPEGITWFKKDGHLVNEIT